MQCLHVGQVLAAESSPQSHRVQQRLAETRQLWEDLRELANARQEVPPSVFLSHIMLG